MEYKEFEGENVTIMSCSNCNIKCKHCYISYKGNFEAEDLYKMCEDMSQKYKILINGTEVILHPEYFKCFKDFKLENHRIMTNGIEILRNEDVLDKLKESGIEKVSVSYHFGIQSKISVITEEQLKEIIRLAKKHGFGVQIMVSLNKDNYKDLLKMCNEAEKLGAYSIRFTNFLKMGEANNMEDVYLGQEELQDFFELLNKARSIYDEKNLRISRCGSFGNDNYHANNFKCPAGINNVAITPNKKVYPCNFLVKEGYEIGEVINNKIYINRQMEHNGKECIAQKIYNDNKEFDDYCR